MPKNNNMGEIMSTVQEFTAGLDPSSRSILLVINGAVEEEVPIEWSIGEESGVVYTCVEMEDVEVSARVTAADFVEDYLDSEERMALFLTLREHLLENNVMSREEMFTDPEKAVEEAIGPAEPIEPEEVPAETPRSEELTGSDLREHIEQRLLLDDEATGHIILALINSGYTVGRTR
jgi:hypothetical protein